MGGIFVVLAILLQMSYSLIDKASQTMEKSNEAVSKAEATISRLELAEEKILRTIEAGEAQAAKVNAAIDELQQPQATSDNDNTKKHRSAR